MLPLDGSGGLKQFVGNGISLFVTPGGLNSGCVAGHPGCDSVVGPGVGGDSIVFWLGAGKMDAALLGAEKYLQFFMGALEYAVSPHARSPMFAKSFGSVNRDMAWGWITD